jgi:DNA-binding Lrp family transcriptional regulator
MAKTEAQPKQVAKLPISWLSEGVLKTSILLRQEAARTGKTSEALTYLLHEKLPTKLILAAFPSLDRPDEELASKASHDYSRCILAKSIDGVYKKITPKYRNEAARRQFFKRLAQTAEAINLAESNARLLEIFEASSGGDDVMSWVSLELEKLVLQRIDLASEYETKLNAAKVEFAAALRQLEHIVGIAWPESDHYRPLLRICSFFPAGLVESENTWRWGSQWYPEEGVLNVNPPILFTDPIRKGILIREAASLLSPRNLDLMGHEGLELCEQSEYLAYKLFERKSDKEFWSEARHGMRQKTRFRAHELIDFFQYYEMMVGDSLYHELWSRLKESGDVELTFSDYLNIFSSLTSRPVNPRFDEKELRLIGLLCKRPEVGAGEAARLLGVSIPTAMKAIRDLSRKTGLTFTVLVDMHKIGLIEHLVTIETTKSAHLLSILSRFPYCRQVFRTYGSFELFCVLDLPFEHDDFAETFLNRMVERDLIAGYRLLHLTRDLQAVNFESYDVQKHGWDIHWDSWGLSLRESLARPKRLAAERSTENSDFQFDKLDQNILSILHINCRTPFSAIGRTLGVSGAYVGRRVTKMVRQGLFRYSVWPMKIGAEEWGLVALSCTRDVADTLAQSLSKLPAWRGGIVDGAFEGLLAIVWCPNGELRQFFKAIDDRLVKTGLAVAYGLNSIGEWPIARWLPVDPDDPWKLFGDNGKWLFDADRYMALTGR